MVNNQYGNVFLGAHNGPGPTAGQQIDKGIIHGTRIIKNPGTGPWGYHGKWPPG